MSMEGEESDEDVQGEDLPTVLWERCIQQSIFVDLSEDESLHLSDLESSLALHLSEAESAASESSIHLSGESWSHLYLLFLFFGWMLICLFSFILNYTSIYFLKNSINF